MNIREKLKKALLDEKIKDLDFLDLKNKEQISTLLKMYSDAAYVSVWEYGMGRTWLEYHIHNEEKGKKLKTLYDEKKRGGHPFLVGVYSRTFLQSISSYENPSNRDTQGISY